MAKILIIDDDADIRYTINEICKFAGWDALLAENGENGLKSAVQDNPDLIIVDYHMPVLDGLQTVKKIRHLLVKPIIVLTVDERQEIADDFLAAGATDFALKPIKAPDLIARIKVNLRVGDLLQDKLNQGDAYLTKGINSATLKLITDFMNKAVDAVTIEDITKEVGLAYQTVHRYLMYLASENKVVADLDYGKIGRPKNKYLLK